MQIFVLSQNITGELKFLLHSLLLGIVITFSYDTIRVLRRLIRHHILVVSLEDLLFWILTAISIFTLQYYENNGVFRWFSIVGGFLGMLLYRNTISTLYVTYMTKLLKLFFTGIYRVLNFVLTPVFFAERQAGKGLHKLGKTAARIWRLEKNRLTRQLKMSKLTLCKHQSNKKNAERNGHHEQTNTGP